MDYQLAALVAEGPRRPTLKDCVTLQMLCFVGQNIATRRQEAATLAMVIGWRYRYHKGSSRRRGCKRAERFRHEVYDEYDEEVYRRLRGNVTGGCCWRHGRIDRASECVFGAALFRLPCRYSQGRRVGPGWVEPRLG